MSEAIRGHAETPRVVSQLLHTEEQAEIPTCSRCVLEKMVSSRVGPSELNKVPANSPVSMILIPFPLKRYKDYFGSPEDAGYTIGCITQSTFLPF